MYRKIIKCLAQQEVCFLVVVVVVVVGETDSVAAAAQTATVDFMLGLFFFAPICARKKNGHNGQKLEKM